MPWRGSEHGDGHLRLSDTNRSLQTLRSPRHKWGGVNYWYYLAQAPLLRWRVARHLPPGLSRPWPGGRQRRRGRLPTAASGSCCASAAAAAAGLRHKHDSM